MADKKNLDPINSLKLFGLDKYFSEFAKLFEKKKFPRVLLLSGEKGSGKFTLIFHLINYVLSKKSDNPYNYNERTINKNSFVYKEILSNTSQNFNYMPNENEKKTGIENIREIKKKFSNSSLNDLPRFIVFDDVEILNPYAANSILKFIEEPSSSNYFVLINNKKQNIIETIKSRALETKIFLNKNEKDKIFEKLLKNNAMEEHFIHTFKDYTTPGKLIRFSDCLKNLSIDVDTSFYDTSSILLEKYKKTKNEVFLDCLRFFLEIKYTIKKNNDSKEIIKLINKKNNLMKLLYDYRKFNLTNNVVLEHIKISQESHA
tara:strand:- start:4908 stop:5858 length:951 start_codon:yes stop_codon:yes gene_type:complete